MSRRVIVTALVAATVVSLAIGVATAQGLWFIPCMMGILATGGVASGAVR